MARPSKLTEKQWLIIESRMLKGERASDLAKEYGINRAAISRRVSQQVDTVKKVANQVFAAEVALKALPVPQQVNATNLVDQLRSISNHLAGAANYGAATAHRLAGIANGKVSEIDDAQPLKEEGIESLKGIAVLTKLANEASQIGVNLLSANKDRIARVEKEQDDQILPPLRPKLSREEWLASLAK